VRGLHLSVAGIPGWPEMRDPSRDCRLPDNQKGGL
jgi:hypothetical protein